MARKISKTVSTIIEKVPSGISGLDDITGGGLPKGRPTLVCGSAGCGKTLLAMEFLIRGAVEFNEPGVFIAFEESEEELVQNVASLGFNLNELKKKKKLFIDHIEIEPVSVAETGEYDLEGLFIRLNHAIDSIGAKRVVIDTIETIFSVLPNTFILRAELIRLLRWLKNKGVTVIITGEQGDGTLTRRGLEEYVSDCVIFLDHRIINQGSTRRLRIIKYRGSSHGTNEYPFLINKSGFSVLPITSLSLKHHVSSERISTGIPRLDTMLGEGGFYKGSSILVSGSAGLGKTTIATSFARSVCQRGEKVIYFSFEEAPSQLIRNMKSIGINLQELMDKNLLAIESSRPTLYGLESHLTSIYEIIRKHNPSAVIIDPITSFETGSNQVEVREMLMRVIDILKQRQITAFLTSLTTAKQINDSSEAEVSSLIDTWVLLRNIESYGERNRGIFVLKSRGMPHSNQIREYIITAKGIELLDVYIGPEGVLTGTARISKEAQEAAENLRIREELARKKAELERKRKQVENQVQTLQLSFATESDELRVLIEQQEQLIRQQEFNRVIMAEQRKADVANKTKKKSGRKQ